MTEFSAMARAASYGQRYRQMTHPPHPAISASSLREKFCISLPEAPTDGVDVINMLIDAAEPGLVGNTGPKFYAWVMGASNPVGVAADWLTSVWGQNAAIYQSSPAAAVAEEAVADWILELLDLPRQSSVGLVTGATMAGFVALAAARSAVFDRFGHNFERDGMQNAPFVRIYLSDDTHVSNIAALRHLGFGDANIVPIVSDDNGLIDIPSLENAMSQHDGPKIIIGTAGHINSGGFEDFAALARLAKDHNAWLHVDGAFGLWARVLKSKHHLVAGVELADSWSTDGHKWLQIPYDSGFAIVKDQQAHRRAMDMSASYLNHSQGDGRNPTEFNPELSRRARGFAAWAVFMALGKQGIRDMVAGHCRSAQIVADKIAKINGLSVTNKVTLNQITLSASHDIHNADAAIQSLVDALNANQLVFVKTAEWKGKRVMRLSLISKDTNEQVARELGNSIADAWMKIRPRFAASDTYLEAV
ncbi:MAG: aminotransferase class V-fold PLP-dependent enzyme [Rhizobiaceae bacterium]